jgi:hypothetical protein
LSFGKNTNVREEFKRDCQNLAASNDGGQEIIPAGERCHIAILEQKAAEDRLIVWAEQGGEE